MPALTNCRILITRAAGQASGLAELLRAEGAEPIVIPAIEIAAPSSFCALDAALASLRSFDFLIFTSANAVQAFADRARHLHMEPLPRRIAAIGPATAKAIAASGIRADDLEIVVPPKYIAESLAEILLPHAAGARMLLVQAAVARDTLPETLTAAGASVTTAEAYRTVIPEGSIAELRILFATRPPDAITFTSASTVNHLAALLEAAGLRIPGGMMLASIGPITSQALREIGLEPTVEAGEASIAALVQALTTRSIS